MLTGNLEHDLVEGHGAADCFGPHCAAAVRRGVTIEENVRTFVLHLLVVGEDVDG